MQKHALQVISVCTRPLRRILFENGLLQFVCTTIFEMVEEEEEECTQRTGGEPLNGRWV